MHLILFRDSRVREQFSCREHLSVLARGGDQEKQKECCDRRGSSAKRAKPPNESVCLLSEPSKKHQMRQSDFERNQINSISKKVNVLL